MSKATRQTSFSAGRIGVAPAREPHITISSDPLKAADTEPACPQADFLGVSVHAMTMA